MKSKKTILSVAIALLLICAIGSTVAWLTADGGTVTNTFTESNIDITLTETTGNTYKMIPGWTIDKDPKVTVEAGSEACWLFVEVTESANFDTFMEYAIAGGWKLYDAAQETDVDIPDDTDGTFVLCRKVAANATEDSAFTILSENKVTVKETVTKSDMDNNTSEPSLSFKAYAVQLYKSNKDVNGNDTLVEFTAKEAWDNRPTA
ncbi:MAG: hypothetical protein IKT31_08190 [Firmicutes bacterium]|nr:hypothetical protein [Bacillota bacterium]